MEDKITINLGVAVVPYESELGSNTGSVAEELEDRYGVIGHFVDAHLDEIQDLFLESVTGGILEKINGGESSDSINEAISGIEEMFRDSRQGCLVYDSACEFAFARFDAL